MKIDFCIMSCDDNPLYLDFWPIVSKIWKLKFNITPVLIYIGNNSIISEYGKVITCSPLYNLPIYLQSLWARYYFTSSFPDSTCIISDIDMIPISHYYFQNQLEALPNESYVHLYPTPERNMIPSCYHISKGSIFKKYLNLSSTFEESINQVMEFSRELYNKNGTYWYADEIYATHCLNKKDVTFLERSSHSRLDRNSWNYTNEEIKHHKYIDCHCIRPYSEYKESIDNLVNLLLTK